MVDITIIPAAPPGNTTKRFRQLWLTSSIFIFLVIFYIVLDIIYYRYSFQKRKLDTFSLISIFKNFPLLARLDKTTSPYSLLFQTRYYQGKIIEVADGKVKILIDETSHTFELSSVAILLEKPTNQRWIKTVLTAADIGKIVTLAKGERLAFNKNAIILPAADE